MQSDTNHQSEMNDYVTEDEISDLLNRRKRVRTALWIYASISFNQLPSGTNFWMNLPTQLQFFHEVLRTKFQDRREVLDSELGSTLDTELNKRKTARRHMFSCLRELGPGDRLESIRSLLKVNDSQQLNNSLSLEDGFLMSRLADDYASCEVRNILCPSDPVESKATARIFFGKLIDMANTPPIRCGSMFSFPSGKTPSHANFVEHLMVFQWRIRGLSDPSTCAACLKRSARFLDLAESFGEAAVFFGAEWDTEIILPDFIVRTCDSQYYQWKQLLLSNSVWLKNSCSKLNGLLQALRQIRDPESEALRVGSFQRLLRRKLRDAFGPDILEPRQPSCEGNHIAVLLWGLVKTGVFTFLQHSSQEQLDLVESLFLETTVIAERLREGCYIVANALPVSQRFGRVLEKVQSEFMFHYWQKLISQPTADSDIKMATMERLISKVMSALHDWFMLINLETLEDLSPPIDLLEALRHLAEDGT
ncbi:hypothetical protein FBEOM_12538 [Fusarium beomiforme]|uniref:Uncharacterized protein n=1 Tax=Fusarium beomiforme TaxID=44412 RepID=A0A9P5A8N5_9HYPO|nr:hypothetical protein FBEOM_12538 [Fusarium beomiforme]